MNRVLRRIFGPKRDEVIGEWRKMQNGELHNLYSSPDIVRQIKSMRMRWAGHVARMGGGGEKCTGKEPLVRPRRRWQDGIKWTLRRLAGVVEWIHLAHGRDPWRAVVDAVMNLRVLAPRT
jgi:hypothetical protein